MITKKEIIEICENELKNYNLNPKIKFLNNNEFKKRAKLSPIINQSLKEGDTLSELNIPALFSHKNNTVYFSINTLHKLLKDEPLSIQIRFIKSIILHEIIHIKNRKYFLVPDFNTSLRLEEQASRQFKRHYPALAALGKRICKKYISY